MGVVGLYGIVGLGLAAGLAVVDVRTGRGYALGIFSALLLATTIIVVGSITILDQVQPTRPHPYSLVTTWLLFGYFILAVYATAADLIGAAVVAGKAGHWLWIVGFFVAAAVPTLVVAVPYPYRYLDSHTGYIVQNIGFLGMLVAPEAAVLAYSITRIVHPVAPAHAHQAAPLS